VVCEKVTFEAAPGLYTCSESLRDESGLGNMQVLEFSTLNAAMPSRRNGTVLSVT
jgi:hypothetical protein